MKKINREGTTHFQSDINPDMSGIGESRTELLNWLNDLLNLNYKKVEQCGTGAAYCQIMDSIYGDLPMHRVTFDAAAEYEYQTNYKILQSCLARRNIEKTVYVEKLTKCRFQDNLEFLQWIKKFWMQNKDGSEYDALARRKYRAPTPIGNSNNNGPGVAHNLSVTKRKSSGVGLSNNTTSAFRSSSGVSRKFSNEQVLKLQTELTQSQSKVTTLDKEIINYQQALDIMERERDFYFGKLRDIEILSQSTNDLIKEGVYKSENDELSKFLGKVQHILYATEEGFENGKEVIVESNEMIGNDEAVEKIDEDEVMINDEVKNDQGPSNQNFIIDEETF